MSAYREIPSKAIITRARIALAKDMELHESTHHYLHIDYLFNLHQGSIVSQLAYLNKYYLDSEHLWC